MKRNAVYLLFVLMTLISCVNSAEMAKEDEKLLTKQIEESRKELMPIWEKNKHIIGGIKKLIKTDYYQNFSTTNFLDSGNDTLFFDWYTICSGKEYSELPRCINKKQNAVLFDTSKDKTKLFQTAQSLFDGSLDSTIKKSFSKVSGYFDALETKETNQFKYEFARDATKHLNNIRYFIIIDERKRKDGHVLPEKENSTNSYTYDSNQKNRQFTAGHLEVIVSIFDLKKRKITGRVSSFVMNDFTISTSYTGAGDYTVKENLELKKLFKVREILKLNGIIGDY